MKVEAVKPTHKYAKLYKLGLLRILNGVLPRRRFINKEYKSFFAKILNERYIYFKRKLYLMKKYNTKDATIIFATNKRTELKSFRFFEVII